MQLDRTFERIDATRSLGPPVRTSCFEIETEHTIPGVLFRPQPKGKGKAKEMGFELGIRIFGLHNLGPLNQDNRGAEEVAMKVEPIL